ncbi:hypothetical protein EV702DRAFT_1280581, partial [Suillus placidus]
MASVGKFKLCSRNSCTDPSLPTDAEMEQMEPLQAENIDAVITNNLILFCSIGGLQEQNQKLLKIVRELGSKMEAEEHEYHEALDQEQSEAMREAHEAIQDLAAQLERQKKSSKMTIQAYMKERDAFKAMLAWAERSGLHAGINAAELEDVQARFEAYKTEMGMDSVKFREELQQGHRDLGQVNVTLAKANAKIGYLTGKHFHSLTTSYCDLDNLTKRNQQLYDQYDANLRAEKKIWESIQVHLVQENKTLSVERSHLADLVANVQRMATLNDQERMTAGVWRTRSRQWMTRYMKAQLSQECDAVRHVTLQKDIDLNDPPGQDGTEQLSQAWESLVGAETSKVDLQERVNQLTCQLQGNEEKLAVYEHRPSVVNGTAPATEQDLPCEQQLEH